MSAAAASSGPQEHAARVLHVVPRLFGGGMERALLRLLQASRGPKVAHSLCVLQQADPELLAEARKACPVVVLGGDAPAGFGRHHAWRLRKLLQRLRPEVVHARTTACWLDAALATFGMRHTRLLLGFHGLTSLERPNAIHNLMNSWAARRADAVLSVSEHAAEMLAGQFGTPRRKLRVIHNGIDTTRFRPACDEAERINLRHRLGLPTSRPIALCVANLLPIKAIDVLLHAWARLLKQSRFSGSPEPEPTPVLLLVGEGPQRQELESLAGQLELGRSVQFLGAHADIPELLRAGDLFVLPSRYECCSNAILEAMASGVAIIACAVGGNRELITPGETGCLLPPDRPDLLCAQTLSLLESPAWRRRLGTAARETALAGFALEQWTSQYLSLCNELAHSARPETRASQVEINAGAAHEEVVCAG